MEAFQFNLYYSSTSSAHYFVAAFQHKYFPQTPVKHQFYVALYDKYLVNMYKDFFTLQTPNIKIYGMRR